MGLVYLKDAATLKLDQGKCTGCGFCLDVCPHEVLSIYDSKVSIIDLSHCIECGACVLNCPFDALSLGQRGPGCAKAMMSNSGKKKEPTCGSSSGSTKPSCCGE